MDNRQKHIIGNVIAIVVMGGIIIAVLTRASVSPSINDRWLYIMISLILITSTAVSFWTQKEKTKPITERINIDPKTISQQSHVFLTSRMIAFAAIIFGIIFYSPIHGFDIVAWFVLLSSLIGLKRKVLLTGLNAPGIHLFRIGSMAVYFSLIYCLSTLIFLYGIFNFWGISLFIVDFPVGLLLTYIGDYFIVRPGIRQIYGQTPF